MRAGSHYHFAEVNLALEMDREAARFHRLDIPAGTSVRFEPGADREVDLVPTAGRAGVEPEIAGELSRSCRAAAVKVTSRKLITSEPDLPGFLYGRLSGTGSLAAYFAAASAHAAARGVHKRHWAAVDAELDAVERLEERAARAHTVLCGHSGCSDGGGLGARAALRVKAHARLVAELRHGRTVLRKIRSASPA